MKSICILGNQLFDPQRLPLKPTSEVVVFMREDRNLCTHFRYHKHKIIFFLAAMRKYADELRRLGYQIHYEKLGESEDVFEKRLHQFLVKNHCKELQMFEIEDKFFEKRIQSELDLAKIDMVTIQSPMFLTTRPQFQAIVGLSKKPFMKTFYEAQRKRLKILVDKEGRPIGEKWSFDEDNRQALPKNHKCPALPNFKPDEIDKEVIRLVDEQFENHPGNSADFWLPTDRQSARRWARNFFDQRFDQFGPFEDAFSKENPFVYHSVLTPYLNTGLVTPKDCVIAALKSAREREIPMNSVEGFIRQVIGWREFIRGIYQNYSEIQEEKNFFNHRRKLNNLWYTGNTGIEPLDDVIKKTLKYGYAHHIERLMVVGSLMLLLEVEPKEAHRWFMEMFIDSSDWVMGPNVYGMALFSDGGIFATKPYFCGSNYYKKMGRYSSGDWQIGVDGLYWSFIYRHRVFFSKNHRLSMMVKTVDKFSSQKKAELFAAAEKLKLKLTN